MRPHPCSRSRRAPLPALAAALLSSLMFSHCGGEAATESGGSGATTSVTFQDVASELGIDFRHHHGGSGRRYFIEISAGGVGLFDFDGDGWLDVYLVNGTALPGYDGAPLSNRLYRNERGARFTDVTERSGLADPDGYGCGCAIGDIDGDGDLDVFVTNYGADQLYRNEGDGQFQNVTETSGIRGEAWSSSAAFFDRDGDGDLDLYVCHYVAYDLANPPKCLATDGTAEYCNPSDFPGVVDRLYDNDGSGRFTDVSEAAGIRRPARGFGVTVGDFDDDGDPDLYVANDQDRNDVYINRGDGTFEDTGLFSGAGYGITGRTEAGMGCDSGDLDGDLDLDLVVTNFSNETNTLYLGNGQGEFVDETLRRGLGEATSGPLGFGAVCFDYDLDTDLDLFFANGHVLDTIERYGRGVTFAQRDCLLANDGAGHFTDVSASSGPAFQQARVGRAAAVGDLDNDGDLDLVVSHYDDDVAVYRNESPASAGSVSLDLRDRGGRPAVGARVIATVAGRKLLREVKRAASFQSQIDPRLVIGLGEASRVESVTVRWPSGEAEEVGAIEAGQLVRIEQGQGIVGSEPLQGR